MLRRRWRVVPVFVACLGLATAAVCADPPPTAPMATPSAVSAPAAAKAADGNGVQQVKPDLYYLRDKDGRLQPVLGFTLEDFDRLISQDTKRQTGPVKPAYRLEKIVSTGTVNGSLVELKIRFTIQIDDDDWVRVPLRLAGSILRDTVVYTGKGRHRIDFDAQSEEYIAWLRGKGETPHQLDVTVVTPITTVAGESRLKLSLPRAWSSELTLTVPVAKAKAQVSGGAALDSVKDVNNKTEFRVLGVGSDFSLAWRETTGRSGNVAAVLEASGLINARLDGRSLHTRARLAVRSFGSEFETFRVRLPRQAVLVSGDTSDYTIVPVMNPNGKKDATQVEIRLRSRTTGPVNLELETEQTAPVGEQGTKVEISGFEVVGAVRQWGYVAVQIVGDWQAAWESRKLMRQVDSLPPELEQDGVIAGFEYFAQPFALSAKVVAKESRLHVEPKHLVLLHSDSAELETRLNCRVGGARIHAVQIDMGDWTIDDVGPDLLVNREQLITRDTKPLTIPLRHAVGGELELVIRAHRALKADEPFTLTVPRAKANTTSPAPWVVVLDDELDFEPQAAATKGVARSYLKPEIEIPERQQAPLVYQANGEAAALAGAVHVADRAIGVRVTATVKLHNDRAAIENQLHYKIARQTAEAVVLQIPGGLAADSRFELFAEETPLTWNAIGEKPTTASEPVFVRVALPSPRLGALRLTAKYAVPIPRGTTDVRDVTLPLVMPAEGDFQGVELTVADAPQVAYRAADGFWVAETSAAQSGALKLVSRVPRLEAQIVLESFVPQRDIVRIERMWLQSYFTAQGRSDRLCFTSIGSAAELPLRLPEGASEVEILRNHQRLIDVPEDTEHVWSLPLAKQAAPQRWEVSYRLPSETLTRPLGMYAGSLPRIEVDSEPSQVFWQLVLPAEDQLVSVAGPYTSESAWGWRGWRWGEWPAWQQADLESWAGALPQAPIPERAHQYVLQSQSGLEPLTLMTIRRSLLVLIGAGGALLMGLAIIYLPRLRQPVLGLSLLLLATVGALVYPEPAWIIVQAALPGLALSLLTVWLKRRSLRAASPSVVTRSAASGVSDRVSTRTHVPARPPVSSAAGNTATVQFTPGAALQNASSSPELDA